MQDKKTAREYIALFETLAQDLEADRAHLARVREAADAALSAQDADAFCALSAFFSSKEDLTRMSRSQELMRLRFLITAVENESAIGHPLCIRDIRDFDALMARYTELTLMLRRIEFDIEPGVAQAYYFCRTHQVSPYLASAVLYNMVSVLGHREEILTKLSADALERGLLQEAYGFLSVIESPGEETLSLKKELEAVLTGGAG